MNVPCQVKVPVDLALQLRVKLDQLRVIHMKDVERLNRRGVVARDPAALLKEQTALRERGKRLTIQHLLRACITAGAAVLEGKTEDLLSLIEKDAVAGGRPRGSRAA